MLKYPNQSNTSALSLIPRQVMMIDSKSKDKKKSTSLNSRNVLIVSIAEFLEANGFKKSLSKFRSESKLESDSKDLGVNLEELVCKYLESSCGKEEKAVHGNDENVVPSNEKTSTKVFKKKENTITDITTEDVLEQNVEVKGKKKKEKYSIPVSVEETTADDNVEVEIEEKKKKKKRKEMKSEPVSNSNDIEKKHKATSDKCDGDTEIVEADEKHTGKKKKKNKGDAAVNKLTQNKNEVSKTDASGVDDNTEKESHKKRKRSEFDSKDESLTGEDDPSTAKKIKSEKRTENSNLSNDKTENGELEGHTASTSKKKKQSHEPKTVNAFQRVKVDEVKFVDDRLQDNSYWALDETGSGYGAKAQEVLGQVRGRDFRHEKTKKKRGSYRGGQIDLNSHSIKFNYSDEE